MQLKDVVVGVEYEYRAWAGYEKQRVKVIEVGVPVLYYDHKGAMVEFDNGNRENTVARCLLRPWKEAAEQNERMATKSAKNKAIVSKLHEARLEIETALSLADIDATLSIWETGTPSLIIKFTGPAEAEMFATLLGGIDE